MAAEALEPPQQDNRPRIDARRRGPRGTQRAQYNDDATDPASMAGKRKCGRQDQRQENHAQALRGLLSGGDRRSIASSNEALGLLRTDPERVAELARLAHDGDWLVVMRAMDLLEKLARERPEWIQPYRKLLIGPLAEHESWEIRLQIARALPLLQWTSGERERVLGILLGYVGHPQKFVQAWAADSLARFAERDASLLPVVERLLRDFERSPSRALNARARQIRKRLGVSTTDTKTA